MMITVNFKEPLSLHDDNGVYGVQSLQVQDCGKFEEMLVKRKCCAAVIVNEADGCVNVGGEEILLERILLFINYRQRIFFNSPHLCATAIIFSEKVVEQILGDSKRELNFIDRLMDKAPLYCTMDEQTTDKNNKLAMNIKEELENQEQIGKRKTLRTYFFQFLINVIRKRGWWNVNLDKSIDPSLEYYRKFEIAVDRFYRTKHRVEDYLEMLGITRYALSKSLKAYGKRNPLQTIYERIIKEAKRLLTCSNKNICEISFWLGYDEAASFNRFFKRMTNLTPSEYRTYSQQ